MTSTSQTLRELEHRRLDALVSKLATVLDELHAPDFVLVHPGGGVWSKEQYVGGVLSGRIDYRRFEAISPIEVLADCDVAVLRYRSAIEIAVTGQPSGPLECWHLDSYRRSPDLGWQVLWSQATEIRVPPGA